MAGGPIGGHGPNRVIEFYTPWTIVTAVTAAAAFCVVPQQQYTDVAPVVWRSVPGKTPKFNPPVIVPQQAYTDVPSSVWTPIVRGATPAPIPLVAQGPQPDPSQIPAKLWGSQPIIAKSIAASFSIPPQFDPSLNASKIWASSAQAAGQGSAGDYHWGTHALAIEQAEAIKSAVWKSVAGAPVTPNPIATFFSIPAQQYDATQQAALSRPLAAPQGGVPPLTIGASQADPTQIAARIWASQPPAPIIANPIASFFSVPPQDENRVYSVIWSSLVAGQTKPIIPSFYAAPQQVDLTQQAVFVKPGRPTGAVPPLTSGTPQTDPTQIAANTWRLQPPPIGPVPPLIIGVSQTDPTQLAAKFQASVPTPPAIAGVTVWPTFTVPAQFDTTINATVTWTPSTFSPGGPPPAPAIILDSGVRHHRPLVIRAKDFEKREDLAAFLKAQLKLRTPTAIEEIPATAESLQASDIPGMPVLSEQERAKLLSTEKQRTTAINNQILAMILAMYDDDDDA